MIKKLLITVSVGAFMAASPAVAQDKGPTATASSSTTSPMLVVDTQGEHVATILGMSETTFKIQTDKHIIELPASSFAFGDDGNFILALSQMELNNEYEAGIRAIEESVSVGKAVRDVDLQAAGMIEAMTDDAVMIRLANNTVVAVPTNGITPHQDGAILGYRNADLEPLGVELTPEQVQEQVELVAQQKAENSGEANSDDAAAQ